MLMVLIFLNVRPELLLLTYFTETIIVGIIYVFKMSVVWTFSKECSFKESYGKFSEFFLIPFFILHYFFFIGIQSVFVFTFFREFFPDMKSELNLIDNYLYILSERDVQITIIGLIVFNVSLLIKDFLLPGQYYKGKLSDLMAEPYLRIFIQQLVVIVTGFFFFFNQAGFVAGVLLIVFRMLLDLCWIATEGKMDFFNGAGKTY